MSSTAPDPPIPTTDPETPTEPLPTDDPTTEAPTEPTEAPTEPPTLTDDPTETVVPPPPPPPPPATSTTTSATSEPTSIPTSTSTTSTTSTSDTTISEPPETTITSVVTSTGDSGDVTTIVLTSTAAPPTQTVSITNSGSSTSTAGSALTTAGAGSDDSGGLSPTGTIAVAVVVPVVSVTLIIIALIIWWRKREANKRSEQQRKSEIEDYSFNPNNGPTLPGVAGGSNFGDGSEMREDNSGYRGWGTTSTSRKLSTNLSSGPGVGNTVLENGSNRGYHHAGSPSDGTVQYSDGPGRISGDSETIGALGMVPPAANNRTRDIARGPSNASSAGSGGSEDGTLIDGPGGHAYYEDNPYYNHGQPQHGPYGDGTYASGHPVIRDVMARRNTRIENPSVVPQQGNAGISQNF